MKKFVALLLIFVMALTNIIPVWAYDIPFAGIVANPLLKEMLLNSMGGNDDIIYPPDSHPRVLFTKDYIPELKKLKDSEMFGECWNYVMELATKPLPSQSGQLSNAVSRQLEARAFMYAMGEVDKNHAKETVDYTIKYIARPDTAQTYSISVYKDFGTNGIQTGAMVYDWCHDVMNGVQSGSLAENIRTLMYGSEQPCRPDNMTSGNWSDIAGYAVGQPIIYNSLAAISLYDVYPEIYMTIMPKIQGSMADIMRDFGQVGALSDGSISYIREYYSYYVSIMLERISGKQIYGDQTPIGYTVLHSRLPFGGLVKKGDDWMQATYQYGKYINSSETTGMGLAGVIHKDPYLFYQYLKENSGRHSLEMLLYFGLEMEGKLPDDLPLAHYVSEPRSELYARTSWKDGNDSPAVVAYMNMNNRRTGDHDHGDIGNFQLYYKGPLTTKGGVYDGTGWGGSHWNNYLTRSIAANCMLVYDPQETFGYANTMADANDGGQKMVKDAVINKYSNQMADDNIWAITESHYIGPNEYTPAFSYIKGDLTKAYTNKVTSHKRSMVFMDMFDDQYPGAMLVFDRVVSQKPEYKKTWLLHANEEPVIDGNTTTITATKDGMNGKLVNKTLLPAKVDITKIGGEGHEFEVGGVNYPPEVAEKESLYYAGSWRTEISPAAESKEDVFLNAMYVTDNDKNLPILDAILEEQGSFVGATIKDRTVMFAKSGEFVSAPFSINIRDNGSDNVYCMITDVAEGKWEVTGGGESFVLESTADSHSLVFTGKKGTEYKFAKAKEDAEVTAFEYEKMPKAKTGDFVIKANNSYICLENENKLINGSPYVDTKDFVTKIIGGKFTMTDDETAQVEINGSTATFKAGEKAYTLVKNGETNGKELKNAPVIQNGIFYLDFTGFADEVGMTMLYIPTAKQLRITVAKSSSGGSTLEGLDESKVISPAMITASTDDGNTPENTIDRNLDTRWSSVQGDGEWICFDLGEEKDIAAVMIAFYNGDKRNWKFDIQVAGADKQWKDVLVGQKSAGTSKNLERFTLPSGTKARYVRYVGHGEEVTSSFYNSLTEIVITK